MKKDYDDPKVYIIDDHDLVHMAHIDIHYGYAVNGVAELHTQILKESELKPFYDIYPENLPIKQTVLHSADGCFTAITNWRTISGH